MKAKDFARKMNKIAEEHPEAEVRVDPPYVPVRSILHRKRTEVIELRH